MNPRSITRSLTDRIDSLPFAPPVTHVYNPMVYARKSAEAFLDRYAHAGIEVLLLGMNPGPFGMAQTGVPFGEISAVRDWLEICEEVGQPADEHPKRPIHGFDCARSEVSGARLWGWAQERFKSPGVFFERFFVWNYCPLVFLEESGRNRTPDKLPAKERDPLFEACDQALREMVECLQPELVLGVGKFAEGRARAALGGSELRIGTILHPSPASPIANRGWAPQVEKQLTELGVAF